MTPSEELQKQCAWLQELCHKWGGIYEEARKRIFDLNLEIDKLKLKKQLLNCFNAELVIHGKDEADFVHFSIPIDVLKLRAILIETLEES